ncbi:MAG: M81 family metallopeptidase [Oscillospiraceae bacterium]|nr:M81 family metallopeptidase [Oscillospiraceae bacterium]
MKVLTCSFTHESNMFTPELSDLDSFDLFYVDEMLEKSFVKDIFEEEGIELIPTIYAYGGARGYVKREAFDYIAKCILDGVREHKDELDGMFLFLHGASHIVDLPGDSGEPYILEEIRKIVGWEMPIAVAMDPHGNVNPRYTELANIVRCYRESPHTDSTETKRHVARLLIRMIKNKGKTHPVYARVPILVGGERCVSFEEPLNLINKKLDEAEKIPGIMSTSYHVGFAWADSPMCCAGVMVVPEEESGREMAQKVADDLADFAFSKRFDFHFTGNAMEMERAMDEAIAYPKGPVFLSDAGDNTTAGAIGVNTVVLRQLLSRDLKGKRALIATIYDRKACAALAQGQVGETAELDVGAGIDQNSAPVHLKGVIQAKGRVHSYMAGVENLGDVVTLRVGGVDVAVADNCKSFAIRHQFEGAGLEMEDYDIIVVKQGYLFPELKKAAAWSVMSLTPGPTDQLTENFDYKTIHRPMFPVDRDFTSRV